MSNTSGEDGRETVFWYAMCAYKKEMYAQKELEKEHIECFVPICYTIKEYHGRKERVLAPAISNLVFVHTTKSVLTEFKIRNPYLQYITQKEGSGRKLLIVPDDQMHEFIRIAQKYEEELTYYKPEEICLTKGTKVRVHGGVFDGVEGTLLKVKGKRSKRIVVTIPGIVAIAAAYIEPELIEIIP